MSRLKYKVGDRVKIQSLERYNKYKNRNGDINYGCETEILFTSEMSSFCGQVATITRVRYIGCVRFYHLAEDKETHLWVDGMFERLVERNGKKYPYKIGDRVVLKGNNRCATITDLKYNSWGNLSYYIKIDNDKDISVDYPTDLLLPYDKLVEEECPQEFIEKYCKSCGTQRCDRTKEYLNGCPYYNAYMCEKQNNDVKENTKFGTTSSPIDIKLKANSITQERVDEMSFDTKPEWLRCEISLPDNYIFKDENGNVINAQKIVLEKKKKEYPKTYEECCDIIEGLADYVWGGYKQDLFKTFHMLYICRDAYWKIAGDEMELGKPWEPDYKNEYQKKYCIYNNKGDIAKSVLYCANAILSFPTKEMRDTFYENFKSEIEFCKEFL